MLKQGTGSSTPVFVETFLFDDSPAVPDSSTDTSQTPEDDKDRSLDGMPAVAAEIVAVLGLGKPFRFYDEGDGRVIRALVSPKVFTKSIVVSIAYQVLKRDVDPEEGDTATTSEEPMDLQKVAEKDARAVFKLLKATFGDSKLPGNRVILPKEKKDDNKNSGNQQGKGKNWKNN